MPKESIYLLSKMNFKYVTVIGLLIVTVVFLTLDRCGSSRKADELRGQYEKAKEIAEVERRIKEETIREQEEKIGTLNTTIVVLNTTIAEKERSNVELSDDVRDLELSYDTLNDKDEKIENLTQQVSVWKEKFNISQSIISDKDAIIFSLTEKYESQVKISISYKDMYESVQGLVDIRTRQVKELENINRRLRLTSGLKTGVVITMAGVVLYSLLKD